MNDTTLTLRITRRAIGAAALTGGILTILDGRHLNSRPERTVPAALRYLTKLLDLTKPTRIVLDAPAADNGSTLTGRIVQAAAELFAERRVAVIPLRAAEILTAFAVTEVVDRQEARDLARILWPEVDRVSGKVKPYVADAAAAAAYTECRLALGPPLS